MEHAIPKIIHFCWFGDNSIPSKEKKCIDTWKKMLPDYKIMFWNEKTFDVNSTKWTRTAYEIKKYAFVSDYVRLWALQKYGGIYLDTDVKLLKKFDPLLNQDMFLCFEDVAGQVVATCVMGAIKGHSIIEEMLKYYNRSFDMSIICANEANVIILTDLLYKSGLVKDGKEQWVNGVHIYPRTYFCPMDFFGNWDKTEDTYCIHLFSGSWLPDDEKKKHDKRKSILFKVCKKIYSKIKDIPVIKTIRSKLNCI